LQALLPVVTVLAVVVVGFGWVALWRTHGHAGSRVKAHPEIVHSHDEFQQPESPGVTSEERSHDVAD